MGYLILGAVDWNGDPASVQKARDPRRTGLDQDFGSFDVRGFGRYCPSHRIDQRKDITVQLPAWMFWPPRLGILRAGQRGAKTIRKTDGHRQ